MNPNDVIQLLTKILPWIPSVNEGIREEIQQVINQLKTRR